jgi:hypothetical protein
MAMDPQISAGVGDKVAWCAGEGSVNLLEYVPRFVTAYYESLRKAVVEDERYSRARSAAVPGARFAAVRFPSSAPEGVGSKPARP